MDPNPSATFVVVLLTPAVLILAAVTVAELRKYLKRRARRAEPVPPTTDPLVGVGAERVPAGD